MKLKVPLIQQKSQHDCGVASGMMLLEYYNIPIEYNYFSSMVKRDKEKKINIFELSIALKKVGLNPNIIFFNYFFFNEKETNIKEKINKYYKESKNVHPILTSIKRALNTGVNIEVSFFSLDLIRKLLKKKKPIITLVSVQEFRSLHLEK